MADDILFGRIDQMQQHRAALDMAEESVSQPSAVAGAFDKLRRDAQAIAGLAHASFQHMRDIQLAGDLADGDFFRLVGE